MEMALQDHSQPGRARVLAVFPHRISIISGGDQPNDCWTWASQRCEDTSSITAKVQPNNPPRFTTKYAIYSGYGTSLRISSDQGQPYVLHLAIQINGRTTVLPDFTIDPKFRPQWRKYVAHMLDQQTLDSLAMLGLALGQATGNPTPTMAQLHEFLTKQEKGTNQCPT